MTPCRAALTTSVLLVLLVACGGAPGAPSANAPPSANPASLAVSVAPPSTPAPPAPVPYPNAAMHGVPDDFPVAPGGTEPFPPEVYRERRARLLARLKSGIAVVFAAKSIDEDADERQDADFAYLTGLADEEKGALLLMPGAPEREMLFLEPKTDDEQHFTGYAAELPRRDVEVKTGFDDVRRMDRLGAYALRFARASRDRELSLLVSSDKLDGPQSPELELLQRVAARLPGAKVVDATRELRAMRMAKEPREIEKIARASDITVAAHLEGWRIGKPGAREWDVKRAIEDAFHKGGARHLAYGSIVGAGPDGCVLHTHTDDRVIADGDLVLVDMGAEVDHYATDVTRTFPANGRFTPEQRAVYDVVLRAQNAALAAVHAGVTWRELNALAKKVIGDAGYYDFFVHGLGHHVGLDVHDIGQSTIEEPIPENAVITIEPGVYIPQKRIGVRIEDTIVVTKTGYRNLSEKLPRDPDAIEKWIAAARK